ncbi:MAG: hypothetical protein H7211_04185 [Aquabacterium sp.]|nr:hypothetical protein [Ferruginibacter sp.]
MLNKDKLHWVSGLFISLYFSRKGATEQSKRKEATGKSKHSKGFETAKNFNNNQLKFILIIYLCFRITHFLYSSLIFTIVNGL